MINRPYDPALQLRKNLDTLLPGERAFYASIRRQKQKLAKRGISTGGFGGWYCDMISGNSRSSWSTWRFVFAASTCGPTAENWWRNDKTPRGSLLSLAWAAKEGAKALP